MKIAVLTSGTRGDVQPYVALSIALQARGHDVLLACPDNFAAWVEGHGLKFHSIGVDMQTFLQSPEARDALLGNVFAVTKIWRHTIVPAMRQTLDTSWQAARDADVIIFHPKTNVAVDIAEANGAALVSTAPFPIFPTKAFPLLLLKGNFGPWLNRLSYKPLSFSRLLFSRMVNRWRKEVLGLGKGPSFMPVVGSKDDSMLRLCAVSPSVVSYPDDEGIHTTGYWFLDEERDWQPDPLLAAFLEAGDPPIYIGFGSMPSRNPERLTNEVIEGVRRAGMRAILATGWGGLNESNLPDSMHVIEGAPHDALFKHVSAVVHHGGAGTTAAGLRAGLPTLICYATFDQPFWGNKVWSLGCGPKPQSLKRLRADRFAQGLKQLTRTESYRVCAKKIGQAIAGEDGIATAIELIEAIRP